MCEKSPKTFDRIQQTDCFAIGIHLQLLSYCIYTRIYAMLFHFKHRISCRKVHASSRFNSTHFRSFRDGGVTAASARIVATVRAHTHTCKTSTLVPHHTGAICPAPVCGCGFSLMAPVCGFYRHPPFIHTQ